MQYGLEEKMIKEKTKIDKQEYYNAEYGATNKENNINKKIIIILVIIIIILLLLFAILAVRLGRIGHRNGDLKEVSSSSLNMINIINVTSDDININKNTQLGIFKNKGNNENIIAPGSKGLYKFCVQNTTDDDIKYDIIFSDLMKAKVNMKYKLKIDNVYIKGNENNYVDISDLSIKEIRVLRNSNNIFTLEWCWVEENDIQDTYAGTIEDDAYYTLNLQVVATRIGI